MASGRRRPGRWPYVVHCPASAPAIGWSAICSVCRGTCARRPLPSPHRRNERNPILTSAGGPPPPGRARPTWGIDDPASLQNVIEQIPDVVAVLDAAHAITAVSSAAERTLGYPPSECVGLSALEFVHPDDRADAERWLDGRERHAGQDQVLCADGVPRPPPRRPVADGRADGHQLRRRQRRPSRAGARPRRHRSAPARTAAAAGAEIGGDRQPRRRHRARLQQRADGDRRLERRPDPGAARIRPRP